MHLLEEVETASNPGAADSLQAAGLAAENIKLKYQLSHLKKVCLRSIYLAGSVQWWIQDLRKSVSKLARGNYQN